MEPFSYYKQYSLFGIKRKNKNPSKRDLPKRFIKVMETMGFKIERAPKGEDNCLRISRGVGTEYFARVDFEQGIVIAKEEENLGKIKTLGLEEIPMRNICFQIPDTYGGGSMATESDIEKRIPRFRDYLKEYSFEICTDEDSHLVKKMYAGKKCGVLWFNCIEVFPHEPWGEELVRLCEEYE